MQVGVTTELQSKKKYEKETKNDHPCPMVSSLNPVRMVRMSETFSIRIDGNMATEQDYWNQMYANACDQNTPSFMYRPKLFIDGNQWCALYGDNLQDGVFGFGNTPYEAFRQFDIQWLNEKPKGNK